MGVAPQLALPARIRHTSALCERLLRSHDVLQPRPAALTLMAFSGLGQVRLTLPVQLRLASHNERFVRARNLSAD